MDAKISSLNIWWENRYLHSLKVPPHKLLITKGKILTLQWRNLAKTALLLLTTRHTDITCLLMWHTGDGTFPLWGSCPKRTPWRWAWRNIKWIHIDRHSSKELVRTLLKCQVMNGKERQRKVNCSRWKEVKETPRWNARCHPGLDLGLEKQTCEQDITRTMNKVWMRTADYRIILLNVLVLMGVL